MGQVTHLVSSRGHKLGSIYIKHAKWRAIRPIKVVLCAGAVVAAIIGINIISISNQKCNLPYFFYSLF